MITGVVLLGAEGMLGRSFAKLLARQFIPTRALSRIQCDIASQTSVDAAIDDSANLVINCAAYTNVDQAESEPDKANLINGQAPGLLATRCNAVGAKLVHFSTDYVFSGLATSPYATTTPRDPGNAYGRSKARGEEAIEAAGGSHLILRTSWLYAPWGKNFVRTIAKLAAEKETLTVVNDQRGRPTSCEHLANLTMKLLAASATGIYHATDNGECTWFDFAAEIAAVLNLDCDIQPCTTDKFPRPARRPAYSVLDLSRTTTLVGPIADWQTNLTDVLHRLEPLT